MMLCLLKLFRKFSKSNISIDDSSVENNSMEGNNTSTINYYKTSTFGEGIQTDGERQNSAEEAFNEQNNRSCKASNGDAIFQGNNYQPEDNNYQPEDIKSARLMQLVGNAIEEWAEEFHLEKMPKKIIFEQALDALQVMEPMFFDNNSSNKQ